MLLEESWSQLPKHKKTNKNPDITASEANGWVLPPAKAGKLLQGGGGGRAVHKKRNATPTTLLNSVFPFVLSLICTPPKII